MQKQVLIRRPLAGGSTQMVTATVLSESNGVMRVIPQGTNRPVEVKASDVTDAQKTFGTLQGVNRGMIVQKVHPDNPNSLVRIMQQRGF